LSGPKSLEDKHLWQADAALQSAPGPGTAFRTLKRRADRGTASGGRKCMFRGWLRPMHGARDPVR